MIAQTMKIKNRRYSKEYRKGYLLALNGNINYETQCRVFLHEIKHIITDMPTIGYVIGIDIHHELTENDEIIII